MQNNESKTLLTRLKSAFFRGVEHFLSRRVWFVLF